MMLVTHVRLIGLFLTLGMVSSSLAHHSFAVYDNSRSQTLKGVVTQWQWSNPHAYLELDVKDAAGALKHYVLEGTSINIMMRGGWRSNMIKVGDQVTAVAAPTLNGESTGLLLEVTLANGQIIEMPIPAGYSFKRTP